MSWEFPGLCTLTAEGKYKTKQTNFLKLSDIYNSV